MKYLGQSYSQISGTAATSAPEMPLQIFFFKTQNRLRSYYLLEGDYSNVSDSWIQHFEYKMIEVQ